MPDWEDSLDRSSTGPETRLSTILDEMIVEKTVSKFLRNELIVTPFRDYPIEADVLVDDVLVIEVQSVAFHVGMKIHGKYKVQKTRAKKDQHKYECFEQMGYGVLWLYDDELNKASIPKYREAWRPIIKHWIEKMLEYAKKVNKLYNSYQNETINVPTATHPDLAMVSLRADSRRL